MKLEHVSTVPEVAEQTRIHDKLLARRKELQEREAQLSEKLDEVQAAPDDAVALVFLEMDGASNASDREMRTELNEIQRQLDTVEKALKQQQQKVREVTGRASAKAARRIAAELGEVVRKIRNRIMALQTSHQELENLKREFGSKGYSADVLQIWGPLSHEVTSERLGTWYSRTLDDAQNAGLDLSPSEDVKEAA